MKIVFANREGEVIFMDPSTTLGELVKMGIALTILPWGQPEDEPHWVHVPPKPEKKKPRKKQ